MITQLGKYAVLFQDTITYTADGTPVDKEFVINHDLGNEKVLVSYMQDYITSGLYGGKELTSVDVNTLKIKFKNCTAGSNNAPIDVTVVLQCIIYIPHSIQVKL